MNISQLGAASQKGETPSKRIETCKCGFRGNLASHYANLGPRVDGSLLLGFVCLISGRSEGATADHAVPFDRVSE